MFDLDRTVTDEHLCLPRSSSAFWHHIQHVAACLGQGIGQFEEFVVIPFEPAVLCRTDDEALALTDFIIEVLPDIRFPVAHLDHVRLHLSKAFCCQLRSSLPFEAFFFFVRYSLTKMFLPVVGSATGPALLCDQPDYAGSVRRIKQNRVRKQAMSFLLGGGMSEVFIRAGVAKVDRRRIFQRKKKRIGLSSFGRCNESGVRCDIRVTQKAICSFHFSRRMG